MADFERVLSDLEASILDNELLRFFARNPYSRMTVQGLCMRLDQGSEPVQRSLERLVDAGIVIAEHVDGRTIYRCTAASDDRVRELASR